MPGIDRNPTKDRERVLSDAEIKLLWPRLDPALKLILLTGQRPERSPRCKPRTSSRDGGSCQAALGDWPGTKNGRDHRVALSEPALV